jgi:hypothetical protein
MSTLLRLGFLFLLMCAPACAYEVEIGNGAICDTQKQVERLASLISGGDRSAIRIVNTEQGDPTACSQANIAFVRGSRVATIRTNDQTVEIVEILVLGLVSPTGVRATAPAVYYSLFKIDERPV